MGVVFWKELADHFSSRRFMILLALIILIGLWSTYASGQAIRQDTENSPAQYVFLLLLTSGTAAYLPRQSDQWKILRGLGDGCHTLGFDSVVSDRARYHAIRIPSELRRAVAHADLYHGGRFLCRLLARARHAFLSALSENRHRRTCLNGDLALHDALRRYR